MLNHATVHALEHETDALTRRASLGAALTPAEQGAIQGKADKNKGEPMDLNYGPAHFATDADAGAAQKAYEKAYDAARSPEQGWILWLGLALASGLTLVAYAISGRKSSGASLPPRGGGSGAAGAEPGVYGVGAGAAYGTYDGGCNGSW